MQQPNDDTDMGDDVECALCLAATQAAIDSSAGPGVQPEPEMDEVSFLRAAVDYYQAGLEKRRPTWVPCLVRLMADVRGDFPIGHRTVATIGRYEAHSNEWGAVSVVASDGKRLGIKPAEFQVLRFRRNHLAD